MRSEKKAIIKDCGRLRIRKRPNVESDIVGFVEKGKIFNVVVMEGKDDWYRVKDIDLPYGFVSAKFVNFV